MACAWTTSPGINTVSNPAADAKLQNAIDIITRTIAIMFFMNISIHVHGDDVRNDAEHKYKN